MTAVRVLALLGVAAGVALGGLGSRPVPQSAAAADGSIVLAGDFHVHTYPDGLPAWEDAREARRRRLDVVALTSHNSMLGWRLWTRVPWARDAAPDVLVLPGQELTSRNYHLALIGLRSTVDWRQSIAGAAAAAHAQQGVAILAHPAGRTVARVLTDDALRAVDGVEVSHPEENSDPRVRAEHQAVYRRAVALKGSAAAIGSSDFHYFQPIGLCRTYLFVRERTASAVLAAIREGRTVACDARGRVSGPPALAAAVAERCRADASAPPDGDTAAARAGTWLAWMALAVTVLVGASDT